MKAWLGSLDQPLTESTLKWVESSCLLITFQSLRLHYSFRTIAVKLWKLFTIFQKCGTRLGLAAGVWQMNFATRGGRLFKKSRLKHTSYFFCVLLQRRPQMVICNKPSGALCYDLIRSLTAGAAHASVCALMQSSFAEGSLLKKNLIIRILSTSTTTNVWTSMFHKCVMQKWSTKWCICIVTTISIFGCLLCYE